MKADISEASATMGQYLLKGWIMTDTVCPTCHCPLMRSPKAARPLSQFCASCDGGPRTSQLSVESSSPSASSTSKLSPETYDLRADTPPTDISTTMSSPTLAILPVDTPETIRRREQSDRASSEIGARLLKGWAMLGDECPNSGCYGVPLVRPPKPGGGKDPRKECVICRNVYLTEQDQYGYERLVPTVTSHEPDDSTHIHPATPRDRSKAVAHNDLLDLPPSPPNLSQFLMPSSNAAGSGSSSQTRTTSSTLAALTASSTSLEYTLHSLANRLRVTTSRPEGPDAADPLAIVSIADAISRVTQALGEVKQLMWIENKNITG